MMPDEVADPSRQDPGFSGSCPRQDQYGPKEMLHGLTLLGIQAHQVGGLSNADMIG
jgi:hypothetical protein